MCPQKTLGVSLEKTQLRRAGKGPSLGSRSSVHVEAQSSRANFKVLSEREEMMSSQRPLGSISSLPSIHIRNNRGVEGQLALLPAIVPVSSCSSEGGNWSPEVGR